MLCYALRDRVLFDAAVREKVAVQEKEARRHKAENSSRFLLLNKSAGKCSAVQQCSIYRAGQGSAVQTSTCVRGRCLFRRVMSCCVN